MKEVRKQFIFFFVLSLFERSIQVTSVVIKLDKMNELNTISFLTYPHLHDKHLDSTDNNKRIVKVFLVLEHSPSGRVVLIGEVSTLLIRFD